MSADDVANATVVTVRGILHGKREHSQMMGVTHKVKCPSTVTVKISALL